MDRPERSKKTGIGRCCKLSEIAEEEEQFCLTAAKLPRAACAVERRCLAVVIWQITSTSICHVHISKCRRPPLCQTSESRSGLLRNTDNWYPPKDKPKDTSCTVKISRSRWGELATEAKCTTLREVNIFAWKYLETFCPTKECATVSSNGTHCSR